MIDDDNSRDGAGGGTDVPPDAETSTGTASSNGSESAQRNGFPVVGIGASAGGLRAFETFFKNLSSGSGMAFVLVQHLDPNHQSELPDLLQNHTEMPVVQIGGGTAVEPDTVYIIPPNRQLALRDGVLELSARDADRGSRAVIDRFFRSLARDRGEDAVAIVLSGTGTDGAQGIKAIKEAGGITFAQEESDAEYPGMPRGAVGTGMVDFSLPARAIGTKLVEIKDHAGDLKLPEVPGELEEDDSNALQKILALLHGRTGRDFTSYKRSTVLRRIGRRVQLHQLAGLPEYLEYLRDNNDEAPELVSELLISVTNFFRDPEAFEALEREAIPQLFANAEAAGDAEGVRVWVAGCATGEEAYSVAILLLEHNARREHQLPIQVFATDLDGNALKVARRGSYPDSIATDVSEERLERFFRHDGDRYVIGESLRDVVLFAEHNLVEDPPFSKLDLVTCRNVLIYLQSDLQARIYRIFHYALRAEGFLFLGSSETLGRSDDLFAEVERRVRLFRRRPSADAQMPLGLGARSARRPGRRGAGSVAGVEGGPDLAEVARRRLLEEAPVGVVVDSNHEVLYLSGSGGHFLDHPEGAPTRNVVHLAREGLEVELRAALHRWFRRDEATEERRITFRADDGRREAVLGVRGLAHPVSGDRLALITLESLGAFGDAAGTAPREADDTERDEIIEQLENELASSRESLQTTIEELETSNEELRASNEELQSMNEELQSTTEELETSREELQSTNEELITVNQELRSKIEELAEVNNDLENLIGATGFGTLFLDTRLRLKRFTPPATEVFHLIGADLGRPLAHLASAFTRRDFVPVAEAVLDDGQPREFEATTEDGRVYQVGVLPYRTAENRVDGVVITLLDSSERKSQERALALRARLLENLDEAVIATDAEGVITVWNDAAESTFGYPADEAVGRSVDDVVEAEEEGAASAWLFPGPDETERRRLQTRILHRDGTPVVCDVASARIQEDGAPSGYLAICHDVTERTRLLAELEQAHEELETRVEERTADLEREVSFSRAVIDSSLDGILAFDTELRYTVFNPAMCRITGLDAGEILGRKTYEAFPFLEEVGEVDVQRAALRGERPTSKDVPYRVEATGREGFFEARYAPLRTDEGIVGGIGVVRDTTARKRAIDALRASEERFRQVFEQGPSGSCLLIVDEDRVVDANSRCREVLGRSAEALIDAPLREVFEDDVTMERLEHLLDSPDDGPTSEIERTDADGDRRVLAARAESIVFGGRAHVLMVFDDVTDRRRAAEELTALRRRIEEVRDAERLALARDLHDGPLQDLMSLGNRIAEARSRLAEHGDADDEAPGDAALDDAAVDDAVPEVAALLQTQRDDVMRVARELRRSVSSLRSALEEFGFATTLEAQLESWEEEAPDVTLDLAAADRWPIEVQRVMWRVVSEALRNVLQHADADRVEIRTGLDEKEERAVLRVGDDGKGFEVPERLSLGVRRSNFGLVGIEERVHLAGGTLTIDSVPEEGTLLYAELPLAPRDASKRIAQPTVAHRPATSSGPESDGPSAVAPTDGRAPTSRAPNSDPTGSPERGPT